jgi:hypothetical protein
VAHVQGDGEDVGAVVEALLRPVPVVDVPVEDGDALDSRAAGALGGEGDVREEAVAVGLRRLRVVAGRPDERVGDGRLPGEDCLGRGQRRPGRRERRGPRLLGHRRRPGELASAGRTELAHALDVAGVVHEGQLVRLGVAPLAPAEARRERPSLQDRLHVAEPDGVLRVQLGLGEERRGTLLEDAAARVVAQGVVVPEDVDRLHQAGSFTGTPGAKARRWTAASVSRQSAAARR